MTASDLGKDLLPLREFRLALELVVPLPGGIQRPSGGNEILGLEFFFRQGPIGFGIQVSDFEGIKVVPVTLEVSVSL